MGICPTFCTTEMVLKLAFTLPFSSSCLEGGHDAGAKAAILQP